MNPLHSLLKKIIRSSTGRTRFLLGIAGLSLAVLLLLTSVQIQSNYNYLLNNKNNRDSIANFLVINKQLSDATLGKTAIEDSMIDELRKQPFTESVGMLIPGNFKASIQSNSAQFPFYTDISFESVPAEFIDVAGSNWTWNEQADFVPIIIPNQFLDFYNFQFSLSQDLPQLTPAIVKMLLFKLTVYGPKGSASFNAKIVGFSNRISSMMVPMEFMNWGNKVFSTDTVTKASRLVIKTKDFGNPLLARFLDEHQLSADADKTRFSKYRKVVDIVVGISGITGLLMLLFALLVLSLFIQITIASSKEEIHLLVILGASPKQLSRYLLKQFFPPYLFIIGLSIILVAAAQWTLHSILISQQIVLPNHLSVYTITVAFFMILLTLWISKQAIRQFINQ